MLNRWPTIESRAEATPFSVNFFWTTQIAWPTSGLDLCVSHSKSRFLNPSRPKFWNESQQVAPLHTRAGWTGGLSQLIPLALGRRLSCAHRNGFSSKKSPIIVVSTWFLSRPKALPSAEMTIRFPLPLPTPNQVERAVSRPLGQKEESSALWPNAHQKMNPLKKESQSLRRHHLISWSCAQVKVTQSRSLRQTPLWSVRGCWLSIDFEICLELTHSGYFGCAFDRSIFAPNIFVVIFIWNPPDDHQMDFWETWRSPAKF